MITGQRKGRSGRSSPGREGGRARRVDTQMSRVRRWGLQAMLMAGLAGCGAPSSQPIGHNLTAAQVKTEVLRRMAGWDVVRTTIDETVQLAGRAPTTVRADLIAEASPPADAVKVTTGGGVTEIFRSAAGVIRYQPGSAHYDVLAAWPHSEDDIRILGTELPGLIRKSRVTGVRYPAANVVVISMVAPLPNGISAQSRLWFDLTTNTPMKWQAVWNGGRITEVPRHFQVNPVLGPSALIFTPPSGVSPEVTVALNPGAGSPTPVHLPVVLPPAADNLTLEQITAGQSADGPVVLLTYTTPQNTPLLITEGSGGFRPRPPAGVTVTAVSVGNLVVDEGMLPLSSDEWAGFTVRGMGVAVESSAAAVNVLLDDWGSGGLPSGSVP